jgi:LCP family protein required for cell wall assembly
MKERKIPILKIYLMINSIILSISTIILTLSIIKHDILPTKYLIPALIIEIIIPLVLIFLMLKKNFKNKIKIALSIISIPIIILYGILSTYLNKTYKFIENIIDDGYIIENYSVIVLNNNTYNELKDLENKTIGYYKQEELAISEALNKIQEEISIKNKEFASNNILTEKLLNGEIPSIIIEESYRPIIEETIPDINEKTKVIHKIEIKRKKDEIVKNVDVKNETFNIYISGIDVYGNISSVSRSDVNIVASVNPETHQMLLISIPRDYYVQLDGTTGYKDKLTHAGIYGVDKSVKTLENLLDIEINYYIKVNFSSVEKMIDTIGGVDVYSKYTFIGYENSTFKEGFNRVNGKQGLEFARTRKTVEGGDRTRGENQEALIQAILDKITSKEIITKYTNILDALNGTFQTNMPMENITDLLKKQLNDMSSWTVTSISLDGYDASRYTYSCPGQLLYVMEPDEESIEIAKQKIQEIKEGQLLEGSYKENITGNVNIPITIAVQPEYFEPPKIEEPKEEPKEEIKEETKENEETEENEDNSETDPEQENQEETTTEEENENDNNEENNEENEEQNQEENIEENEKNKKSAE